MGYAASHAHSASDEQRLSELGLSTELIHDALRRGAQRAANRSAHGLRSSPGTDIYHDGMEDFADLLTSRGWRRIDVMGQPRLLHPTNDLAFTISAGINVGSQDMQKCPRTRPKGKATRGSLTARPSDPVLFGEVADDGGVGDDDVPFYLLLCQRDQATGGVHIELASPAEMTEAGSVIGWNDRVRVGFLALDGDLSVFDKPVDEDDAPIDVSVDPL